jgi:hypothetical protein
MTDASRSDGARQRRDRRVQAGGAASRGRRTAERVVRVEPPRLVALSPQDESLAVEILAAMILDAIEALDAIDGGAGR